jgi:PAS domain S-box-containing protein
VDDAAPERLTAVPAARLRGEGRDFLARWYGSSGQEDRRRLGVEALENVDPGAADPLRALGSTADGMVAIAPGGRILSWNAGATRLLGYTADEVVGRYCYDVFDWLDRCGNPVCGASCPDCRVLDGDEIVQTRDVIARSKDGKALWLSVSTLVPPLELRHQSRLVHLFREIGLPPELERLVAERLQSADGPATEIPADPEKKAALERLTRREREILRLLAEGADTKEIAERLTLSLTTVRNHVQNILEKLGVHSRLEAAVLFVRYGE